MPRFAEKRNARFYLTYLLWYTLLFALATAGILFWFVRYDKSLVWSQDALPQYIPNAYYFIEWGRTVIKNFLSGNFSIPGFDFSIGLGETVPAHMEPLYWLYLLFSPENVETAFSFLFLLRFYLAGLSMSVFLLYFENGVIASLMGSIVYLYSDYGLWGCFRHSQFMMAFIMLPLCLLAIEEIYRKKRWYLCTIVICIHMWAGYYFAYMNTIAMGFYFLLRFFCNKEGRTFKNFWLRMRTIVCSYLLGVAMGNFALVATLSQYLTSSRTEAVDYGTQVNFLFHGIEWLKGVFLDFMTPGRTPGQWLRLGFVPLSVVAVIAVFLKKGKRELKGAFLLCLACCLVPAAAFVFSGFNSITNRWSYIMAFVMAIALAFALEDLKSLSGTRQILLLAACAPFLLNFAREILTKTGKSRYYAAAAGAALVLALAAVLAVNHAKRLRPGAANALFLAVALISVWGNGFQEFSYHARFLLSEFADRGEVLNSISATPLAAATEIEDDSFYRVSARRNPSNMQGLSKILGYNGTVNFSNTTSKTVQDFYRSMGLTSWSMVRMNGFEGRAFLETLSGVKYFIIRKGRPQDLPYGYEKVKEVEKNGKTYVICKSDQALPLGYTYSSVTSEDELMEYDTVQRAEVLMQAACVENVPSDFVLSSSAKTGAASFESTDAEALSGTASAENAGSAVDENGVALTGSAVDFTVTDAQNMYYKFGTVSTEKDASLTLSFDVPEEGEVYIYAKGVEWDSSLKGKIKYTCGQYSGSYWMHGLHHIYYTGQEDYILNLGTHEAGEDTLTLTFPSGMELSYDSFQIYCQPVAQQQTYVDGLTEDVLENVVISDNRVEGTISLDSEKLLVLTLPYGSGWTAYVDGEETKIERANLMYSGLFLEPGEHTIVFEYHMPGATVSISVSAAGFAVFIAALLIRRRRRKMEARV